MDEILLSKIIELGQCHDIEKIESLLEKELQKRPKDIDLLLRLSIIELALPLGDYPKSMFYLNKVLEYDKNNAYALILLGDINHSFLGGINDNLFEKLDQINLKDDNQLISIIELIKAWYHENNNDKSMYVRSLLKSIELDKDAVYNYKELAQYYLERDQKNKAYPLLERALKNIQLIYSKQNPKDDLTDVDQYIDEMLRGTKITQTNVDVIKDLIDQCR